MAWVYLIIAGLLEIVWAIALKYTYGFTKFWPSVATIAVMAVSFLMLSMALRTIPVGTGYVVWTGIGAVGTVVVGMLILGEPVLVGRIFCLLLIIVGIIGLKLISAESST